MINDWGKSKKKQKKKLKKKGQKENLIFKFFSFFFLVTKPSWPRMMASDTSVTFSKEGEQLISRY